MSVCNEERSGNELTRWKVYFQREDMKPGPEEDDDILRVEDDTPSHTLHTLNRQRHVPLWQLSVLMWPFISTDRSCVHAKMGQSTVGYPQA